MNLVITDFLTEYKNVCEVNVIDVNVDIVKFYSDDQNWLDQLLAWAKGKFFIFSFKHLFKANNDSHIA